MPRNQLQNIRNNIIDIDKRRANLLELAAATLSPLSVGDHTEATDYPYAGCKMVVQNIRAEIWGDNSFKIFLKGKVVDHAGKVGIGGALAAHVVEVS